MFRSEVQYKNISVKQRTVICEITLQLKEFVSLPMIKFHKPRATLFYDMFTLHSL